MFASEQARIGYFEKVIGPLIENLRVTLDNGTDDEVREAVRDYQAAISEMRAETDFTKLTKTEREMIAQAEELTHQAHAMNLD